MAGDTGVQITGTDPCADFGPTQRWALFWFVAVLLGGVTIVYKFASIDRWMYDNNAEFLDMKQYKENRVAQTSIPSESIDPRSQGDLSTVRSILTNSDK